VVGTTTVLGTVAKELAGILTTADEGTEAITEVGTESGTLDQAIIATDGLEATTMT